MKIVRIVKHLFFVVISLLSFSGCESLVNDIDKDKLPKMESKLVVESYISPQSKNIQVIVSESQPLFGVADYQIKVIKNATVTLSGASGQVVIPFIDSLSVYTLPASKFKIEAGQTYRLTVSDSKRTVKATCTVPAQSPALKRYTMNTVEGQSNPWDSTSKTDIVKVKFYWDDIPNEKNVYILRGYSNIDQNQFSYDSRTDSLVIYRGGGRNVFNTRAITDVNMDGLTLNSDLLEIRLYHYTYQFQRVNGSITKIKSDPKFTEIYLEIMTIDENYYKFQQTRGQNSEDNPFVEPTLVYTNIEGGLGCFGAYNASSTTIKP